MLLKLPEISQKTRVPVNTLRYWRHLGEGPKMFRLGRSIVAYEDDIDAWIAEKASAGRAS